MEDQLISFETAKLAKEKGFNEATNAYYNLNLQANILENKPIIVAAMKHNNFKDLVAIPTQSLLQKWLREVRELNIEIRIVHGGTWTFYVLTDTYKSIYSNNNYINYEEALEVGLQEALKLL